MKWHHQSSHVADAVAKSNKNSQLSVEDRYRTAQPDLFPETLTRRNYRPLLVFLAVILIGGLLIGLTFS